jgi:hypothetical protein
MMNAECHIKFARSILKLCSLEEHLAYLANFHVLIGFSSTQKNLVYYSLDSIPDLFEVMVDVFSTLDRQEQDIPKTKKTFEKTLESIKEEVKNSSNFMENYYYKKRLFFYSEILGNLEAIKTQYSLGTNSSGLPGAAFLNENKVALFLSATSYIYFDLWMRPQQVFSPRSSFCSGAWGLWDEIDYPRFAEYFSINNDEGKCFGWFEGSHWSEELDGLSMLKAIIICMGEMGSPPISYSIIDWNIRILLRYLDVPHYCRADTEVEFLKKRETRLKELFKQNFAKQ